MLRRLNVRLWKLQLHAWEGYAAALMAILVVLLLQRALAPWLPDQDFIPFLPAIILITLLAGLGPTILITLLSGIAVWYFYTPPYYSFTPELEGVAQFILGLAGTLLSVGLVYFLGGIKLRLAAGRARGEGIAKQRELATIEAAAELRAMARLNELADQLDGRANEFSHCLNEAVAAAIAITGADKGILQIYEPGFGTLAIRALCGFDEQFRAVFARVRLGGAACPISARSTERVIVEDIAANEAFARQLPLRLLIEAGGRAAIFIPLVTSERDLLGVVSVHFHEPHRATERELHFLDFLARQVTSYLIRRRIERADEALFHELKHRNNNLLAIVQSIVSRTLSGRYSLQEAKVTLEGRLQALARANRQLSRSNWEGTDLGDIVRLELEPFFDRAIIEGGAVELSAEQALHCSLALHELATNASKYGSLSDGNGRVHVSWNLSREGEDERLNLRWHESGGPPVVPPTRHGFGTSLLKAMFPDVRFQYAEEGLKCEFTSRVSVRDKAVSFAA
jgi:two-component sensor histidine kinase